MDEQKPAIATGTAETVGAEIPGADAGEEMPALDHLTREQADILSRLSQWLDRVVKEPSGQP